MKKGIHPEMKKTKVTCICGAEFPMQSTRDGLKTEICSNCHPFYTGKTKRATIGGRVERFNKKYGMENK